MSEWPKWRYGPGGSAQIFQDEGDVPADWHDHPSKAVEAENKAKMAKARAARKPTKKGKGDGKADEQGA